MCVIDEKCCSLRASSPIWASEANLARTRERAAKSRGAGERPFLGPLARARSREAHFAYPNRRACSQAKNVDDTELILRHNFNLNAGNTKIVPVTNNTKATIERNKIGKLTHFIINEVVVVLFIWSPKPFWEDIKMVSVVRIVPSLLPASLLGR